MWRMTWYSSMMPLAPCMSRARRAMSSALPVVNRFKSEMASDEVLKPAEVEVALLVNEHVRDRITIDAGLSKSVVLKQALARDAIRRCLGEREPYHVVWVQDRLLKILLKEAKEASGPGAHPAAPHRPAAPGAAVAPPGDPA